jgi:lysozyme
MMRVSEQGLELIKQFEGFSAEPYYCPGGKLTIGYGHVMTDGESSFIEKITKEHAEELLRLDTQYAENAICNLVTQPLSQNQFDALVSFIYNIGSAAFEKSTLLRLLNAGDMNGAAKQFGRWIYAAGHKLEGLVRRRVAEAEFFLSTRSGV